MWSGLGRAPACLALGHTSRSSVLSKKPPCLGTGWVGIWGRAGGTGVLATSHQACVPTVSAMLGVEEEAARRVTAPGLQTSGP